MAANAGTAYAFAGRVGEAVLFSRRALALDPSYARARQGLEVLRERLPIRPPPPTAVEGLWRSLSFWTRSVGFRVRLWLFAGLCGLGAACLLLRFFTSRPRSRVWIALLLACGLACFGSCLVDARKEDPSRVAVVLVRAEGRTGRAWRGSPKKTEERWMVRAGSGFFLCYARRGRPQRAP